MTCYEVMNSVCILLHDSIFRNAGVLQKPETMKRRAIEAKHVLVTFSVSYLALLPFVDFIAEVGQSGQTARASAAIVTLSRHPPDLNTWIRPI